MSSSSVSIHSANVKHAILFVISAIETGLEAERRGQSRDAVATLRVACNIGDTLIPVLPPSHANVLNHRITLARARLATAQNTLAATAIVDGETPGSGSKLSIERPLAFSPDAPGEYTPPPASTLQRPFWLARQLSLSIEGSAWLTPSLKVDKSVWLQDGGASVLSFVGHKAKLLECISKNMEILVGMSLADVTVVSGLDACIASCSQALNDFDHVASSRNDGRVEQLGRIERGVRTLLSKSKGAWKQWNMQQDTSLGTYVAWSFRFCASTEPLERLLLVCHHGTGRVADEALARVHRLLHMLWRGPCRFLLEDALLLSDRYAHTQRAKFGKLTIRWE